MKGQYKQEHEEKDYPNYPDIICKLTGRTCIGKEICDDFEESEE